MKQVTHKECNGEVYAVYTISTMPLFPVYAEEGQIADAEEDDDEWTRGLTNDDLDFGHYECSECGKRWNEMVDWVEKMPADWELLDDDE